MSAPTREQVIEAIYAVDPNGTIATSVARKVADAMLELFAPRCPNCDGSGYVHRTDGELLGVCPCPAGGEGATDG
jgi:Ribonuclease G/E